MATLKDIETRLFVNNEVSFVIYMQWVIFWPLLCTYFPLVCDVKVRGDSYYPQSIR
jgi:hypothetical protein